MKKFVGDRIKKVGAGVVRLRKQVEASYADVQMMGGKRVTPSNQRQLTRALCARAAQER